ncbi:thioredoxin-like protein (plasmid) [Rhizobium phaseoli]|uniref:glutathione S-transferase N-terminal domain-containing protein n=1 Tax=Rhizobium phaseoli TaxID=396 RepID=UPI0007EB8A0F|nr:glutathione S-transferase N-terminal domain-containing protein [Rhizobium phaseoli]ANL31933.1 thioredoxin-like protein [Rhizobium phaseoli]MDK4728648.1 glutathione S-transferase N-terminal domain-containing protein [Rhizobium phaseoli]NKE91055.1 glutathione S-transferase domain-containing protein [Rhizobium phaseoli]
MSDHLFKPVLYLKENCPFCLKIRIFVLEADISDDVQIRDFAPGSEDENVIRAELLPHLDKVSFPAGQLQPGRYATESDDIVAFLAARSGRDTAAIPVYRNYVDGIFATAMKLWKENQDLKKAASAT